MQMVNKDIKKKKNCRFRFWLQPHRIYHDILILSLFFSKVFSLEFNEQTCTCRFLLFRFVGHFVPCYITRSAFSHMTTVNLPFRTCLRIIAYLVLQSVFRSISCTEFKLYRLWDFFTSCSLSLFVIYFILS